MIGIPSIYQLKPAFQRLLTPLLDWCLARRISANVLTAGGLALSLLAGALVVLTGGAWPVLLLYPLLLLVRMALNALDGLVARRTGTSTHAGMVFNEMADIGGDLAMYPPLALAVGFAAASPALTVAVATGVLAELGGIARQFGGGRRSYAGPMGKSDRAFAFGLLAVLAVLGLPAGWLGLLLWLVTGLHLITIANRLLGPLPDGAAS